MTTRDEQIEEAANSYMSYEGLSSRTSFDCYVAGVEWADANPQRDWESTLINRLEAKLTTAVEALKFYKTQGEFKGYKGEVIEDYGALAYQALAEIEKIT